MSSGQQPAPEDFFLTHVRRTIPVSFSVGVHTDANGVAPRLTHHMEIVDGDALVEIFELLNRAGAGKTEAARRQERVEAVYAAWDRLIDSVSGYGAADAFGRDEVKRYFRGEMLPADLDAARRAQILEGMQTHVLQAVNAYFDRRSPEPSFRSSGA